MLSYKAVKRVISLGQRLRTLVDSYQPAGRQEIG